jgi:hypothetical protein
MLSRFISKTSARKVDELEKKEQTLIFFLREARGESPRLGPAWFKDEPIFLVKLSRFSRNRKPKKFQDDFNF